jgi:parallel beta helix pectate lyase-like protein
MARIGIVLLVFVAGSALGASALAHRSEAAPAAAIQRTFVSTEGSDANACTRTAPCRGFAAAIANTLAGGEVVALDSGGYGPFVVDRSISVVGAPGVHAAMTVFSGDGVVVDAAPTDVVVLRNLTVTGLGGTRGIVFAGGAVLHVERLDVAGFATHGLVAGPDGSTLYVGDSRFRDNGADGLDVEGSLRVEIEGTRSQGNGDAGYFFFDGAVATVRSSGAARNVNGFVASLQSTVTIEGSSATDNVVYGVRVAATGAVGTLTDDVLAGNGSAGLSVLLDTSTARISGSTVTGNGTGLLRTAGALESYGDNLVRGNTTNTAGTITTVGKT